MEARSLSGASFSNFCLFCLPFYLQWFVPKRFVTGWKRSTSIRKHINPFFYLFSFSFSFFLSFLFSYLITNVLESVQQLMGIFCKFWGGCLKIKKSVCQEMSRNTLLCNVYGNVFSFKSPLTVHRRAQIRVEIKTKILKSQGFYAHSRDSRTTDVKNRIKS